MHVIVVGCGRVGRELSIELEATGHDVVVIDKNAAAFDRLPAHFKGRTVVGSGFDRIDLETARIADAEAVAAVTSGDNTNILTARIARETFGVSNVVARIYDPRRAVIYQRLGIPTVATVSWTTEQVLRRLDPARVAREWTDPTGTIVLLERALPDRWVGRRLDPIDDIVGARIIALNRGGSTSVGTMGLVGQAGDLLYVAVESNAVEAFDAVLAMAPSSGAHV